MLKSSAIKRPVSSGFTLLEVIVALAITGFVLGSLFSLVGGSKQLGWKSEESLLRATRMRAATNFALLENEYRDVEPILDDETYEIVPQDILEEPERKTQPSIYTLQAFEIVDQDTDQIITGSRWIQLELPQ
ncbi:MAG: type II secretion system protein [Gammaproteobacteria bacterium]|jgi:prepilin-type N-terminal cleavage/methylation domain-containing protein|nr:type II secretion system protein [Gammaproteobacteria bacterium]|tara:strand:- start:262 stop:657 length:396 start_codon:yes stop_codon:yes gene_type:complete